MSDRQEASARVAMAAYLHDLGKFAERARLNFPVDAVEIHEQLYCRRNESGGKTWYTHKHAAWTALGVGILEEELPRLIGADFTPFAPVDDRNADDSLINAAAMHHRPITFLQWIIATADRVASGFERDAFEAYNSATEGTSTGRNHYTARQLTLFEQMTIDRDRVRLTPASLDFRYPLLPLTPTSMFPQLRSECETADNERAQHEYRSLWEGFSASLSRIPTSHRRRLSLWLDHFDSLWHVFTHAIPSATAGNTKPEVSLYDHSRTTAALATALWRYHADRNDDPETVRVALRDRGDWDNEKFLLVQGDFFGIQKFLFASGGESGKFAAKLLRGRSFYVALLTECAALRVLDALDLPSTSQVTNAAGKFLIVAPNTPETITRLSELRREFDAWFIEHTYGQSSIGLAWLPASCNQFLDRENGYRALLKALFMRLEDAKHQAFGLCGAHHAPAVHTGFLDSFNSELGVCRVSGIAPAVVMHNGIALSTLADDQIRAGEYLVSARHQRIVLSRESLSSDSLSIPVLGCHVLFTGDEDATGRFGPAVASGELRRLIDISLPAALDAPVWNGYARRAINGYVPMFTAEDAYMVDRYRGEDEFAVGDIKSFNHLACESLKPNTDGGKCSGLRALGVLKGDVDDLGALFQSALDQPTFAKSAALSRQLNAFFSSYLPALCASDPAFRNVYTIFAGGDDFFLVGPWYGLMQLADRLQRDFKRYCANNPELHFSAGIATVKPGVPVRHLSRHAESALEAAKHGGKNAVTCMGRVLSWERYAQVLQACDELAERTDEYKLTTGFIYHLLHCTDMIEQETFHRKPEAAVWRSRLRYQCVRHAQRHWRGQSGIEWRPRAEALAQWLVGHLDSLVNRDALGADYHIVLTTHLYGNRRTTR